MNLANYKKLIVAAVGGLAEIVAMNVLPDNLQRWATAIVAAATAAGVWKAKNANTVPAPKV